MCTTSTQVETPRTGWRAEDEPGRCFKHKSNDKARATWVLVTQIALVPPSFSVRSSIHSGVVDEECAFELDDDPRGTTGKRTTLQRSPLLIFMPPHTQLKVSSLRWRSLVIYRFGLGLQWSAGWSIQSGRPTRKRVEQLSLGFQLRFREPEAPTLEVVVERGVAGYRCGD